MATSAVELVAPICKHARSLLVERYSAARKKEWDNFVGKANNATFLFRRDYMDYHQDRFADHSLMIFRGADLAAVLPANLATNGTVISHEGLTYGGLVTPGQATLRQVMECFHSALSYLQERQIPTLRYKRIPTYYNVRPDDDVAYCLFLLQARLYRRDCSLVIPFAHRLPLQKRRKRQAQKARRANLRVVQEEQFFTFWEQVLTPRLLSKYGVKPVHTAAEISLLASRFPDGIKQYSVYDGAEIVAGITIYETPAVAHAQYIAATEKGRSTGALDYLVGWLLDERYPAKQYFDFGGSNEEEGRALNHGLLEWKEGFGGRCVAHDFYEIATDSYPELERVLDGSHAHRQEAGFQPQECGHPSSAARVRLTRLLSASPEPRKLKTLAAR